MEHSLSRGGNAAHYKFRDNYDRKCTLHDSSSTDSVWLGLDDEKCRMLLGSDTAAKPVSLLQHFVKHGKLPQRTVRLADVPVGKWVNGRLLMLGDGKLGEPHGPQGSTMRPWSFKECGLTPENQVTVGDEAPGF